MSYFVTFRPKNLQKKDIKRERFIENGVEKVRTTETFYLKNGKVIVKKGVTEISN